MYDVDFIAEVLHSWIKDIQDMRTKFWLQNLKGRDNLEEMGEDEIILKRILRYTVGWCGLASYGQDMSECRALVNTVINTRVS
jgi:hypothetical protein